MTSPQTPQIITKTTSAVERLEELLKIPSICLNHYRLGYKGWEVSDIKAFKRYSDGIETVLKRNNTRFRVCLEITSGRFIESYLFVPKE